MARAKRGFKRRRRVNKLKKLAEGFWGRRKNTIRTMSETIDRAKVFSFRDRKVKKRDFRSLWISRLGAAVADFDLSYSTFINKLTKSNVKVNRKMLSEIAIHDPSGFAQIVTQVKQ